MTGNPLLTALVAPLRAAGLAGILCGGMALAAPASAMTIDVAVFHSERDAFNETYKWWTEEIAKRTQGRVEFKSFYSGSLVPLTEVFNAVRNGVVPAGTSAASVLSGQIPSMAYMEVIGGLPGTPADSAKALNSLEAPLEAIFRQHGMEYLWQQPSFGGGVVCGAKHLKQPADWKGVKVRSSGRWQGAQVQQLGASPTSIDPGEAYLALQNKTVDCALIVMSLGLSLKLHEPAPKVTQFDVPINTVTYLMGKDTWAKISDADKKTIKEVNREATVRSAEFLLKAQDDAAAKMKAAGADLYMLNKEEKAALLAAFKPVFDKIGEASGPTGKPFVDALSPFW